MFLEQTHESITDFRKNWRTLFPSLSSDFELASDKNVLSTSKESLKEIGNVVEFINSILETDLMKLDNARMWYLIQHRDQSLVYTRPAYYFICLFILSSIVRYEPEMLLDISDPYSEYAWIITKLLSFAERYYPQLILIEMNDDRTIYF